jgi:transposase
MENDWLNDYRKVPDETMSYIRKIAVRAIVDFKIPVELVAQIFGISPSAVYAWIERFDKGGYSNLETGSAPGAKLIITKEIESWLRFIVLTTTPANHGFETSLWTCDIMRQLLNREFGIDVQVSTISIHLKSMGLSYQKPDYRPFEQDPKEVDYFLSVKFPRIQRLAEKLDAEIAFEDEGGVGISDHNGRTWGEKGETPEVIASQRRGGYNMLSIVTAQGLLQYSIKDGTINEDSFIGFLRKLLKHRTRPLMLLLDRASFHCSKKVRRFVRAHRSQIRIFFLPTYSPKMNPAEQVWNAIKNNGLRRMLITTKSELKRKLKSQLRRLQMCKEKVKSFFKLRETSYISSKTLNPVSGLK